MEKVHFQFLAHFIELDDALVSLQVVCFPKGLPGQGINFAFLIFSLRLRGS